MVISAFFAFDFMFTGGDPEASGGEAGTLGGEEMSAAEFRTLADEARGIGRQRSDMPVAEANKIAWQTAAALAVAKSANLTATDDEVRQAIRRDPSFSAQGGGFSMTAYNQILASNGMTPEMYESYLKRRLTLSKLNQVVLGSAAWVSPAELEGAINDFTDKFTVKVATFMDKDFAKVKVDDKALEAYYKDNTNSIALPDLASVKYIKYKADAPERLKQFTIPEDEMRDHYDATQSRWETTGTNGVTVTKKFEEVKGEIEKELQLVASLEAYRTNLLFRAYPQDGAKAGDRMAEIAKADNQKIETSKLFALDGRSWVKGFMSRVSEVAPGCPGFAEAVAELDPESQDLRYGVVAGKDSVYLVERAQFVPAHVPTFEEAKEHIKEDALKDAQAKAFKASVEKMRALAAAETAKGKAFDAKLFAGANVSTSITFSVSGLQYGAFPDSMTVAMPTMKLAQGQISEFIKTSNPRRGLLVYVEKREAGDAAQAQMMRSQLRDDLSRYAAMALPRAWGEWNLDRVGYTANSFSSTEVVDDGLVPED